MFPGGLYLHTVYFEAGPSITAPLSSVTPDLQPTIAQATWVVDLHMTWAAEITVQESANIGFKNQTYLSKVASCMLEACRIII